MGKVTSGAALMVSCNRVASVARAFQQFLEDKAYRIPDEAPKYFMLGQERRFDHAASRSRSDPRSRDPD
jgi:hypothetical protein